MNDLTDQQLVRDYAARRSEAAFAELVRRHIDLVHSAAMRMTGEAHSAQDVTQAVFVALTQNATRLTHHPVLSGWLHTTARNLAAKHVRAAVRRQHHEQEAAAMNELLATTPDASWDEIAPHLDAAMGELAEPERNVVLLRYFERLTAEEIGSRLDISEAAAQKRVSRAVERLRELFAKRGVTVGASGLVVVISANAVQAAPVGLAVTISAAALAGAAATTSTLIAATTKTMAMTTLQKTIVTATVAVLAGAGLVAALVALNRGHGKIVAGVTRPVVQLTGDSNIAEVAVQRHAPSQAVYSVEGISKPPAFTSIHVNSFNNQGQVVGSLDGENGVVHAFVWDRGVMTDLGTLGGSKAIACSINDLGEITVIVLTNEQRRILLLQTNGTTDLGAIDGFAKLGLEENTYYAPSVSVNNRSEVTCRLTLADGNQRSFLFRQGRISYFGLRSDGRITDTRAMNNQGDIVGVTIPGNEGWGVFVWHDGEITDLKTLGGPRAGANAINDHGTVVGWASPAGASWDQAHAIVWENGELHDLNSAGWKNSRATGINNDGDIVGWATLADKRTFAFLKRGENLFDLNELIPTNSGWRIVGVSAINERGQMLAQARKHGQSHSVIISPPDLQPALTTSPAVASRATTTLTSPAQLNAIAFARLPNGAFHLRFNGQPGVKYVIEASTNLTTWSVLGDAANMNGQLEFTDQNAPNFPLRFYRVTQP